MIWQIAGLGYMGGHGTLFSTFQLLKGKKNMEKRKRSHAYIRPNHEWALASETKEMKDGKKNKFQVASHHFLAICIG